MGGVRDRCFRERTWGVFLGGSQEPPTGADETPPPDGPTSVQKGPGPGEGVGWDRGLGPLLATAGREGG